MAPFQVLIKPHWYLQLFLGKPPLHIRWSRWFGQLGKNLTIILFQTCSLKRLSDWCSRMTRCKQAITPEHFLAPWLFVKIQPKPHVAVPLRYHSDRRHHYRCLLVQAKYYGTPCLGRPIASFQSMGNTEGQFQKTYCHSQALVLNGSSRL